MAISLTRPKTAALGFDRVWGDGHTSGIPNEIRICRPIPAEVFVGKLKQAGLPIQNIRPSLDEILAFYRTISPFYIDFSPSKSEYEEGDHSFVLSRLTQVGIVDEEALTWEQVIEFRKDKDRCAKYRMLAHWFNSQLVGKSEAFIVGELGKKLYEYEEAIKYHGMKTVIGTLSKLLDEKLLLGVGATLTSVFVTTGRPELSFSVAGAVVAGKVALEVANVTLESKRLKNTHKEGLFLHELKALTNT